MANEDYIRQNARRYGMSNEEYIRRMAIQDHASYIRHPFDEQIMYPQPKPKTVSQSEFFEILQELANRYRENHERVIAIDAELVELEKQREAIHKSIMALREEKAKNPLVRIQDLIGNGIKLEPGKSLVLDTEQ